VTYNVIGRSLTPTMPPRRVTTFRIDEEVLDAMQVVFERDRGATGGASPASNPCVARVEGRQSEIGQAGAGETRRQGLTSSAVMTCRNLVARASMRRGAVITAYISVSFVDGRK
jgi:hypothetical protein